jgi:uncharacterized Zn-binding protein involved in type VI secretion
MCEGNVMAGEIIRMGDPTSHGGKVIEGSMTGICHGKPIAYMGHQTYCPQCKGNFPIIEGAPTTMIYGKGVALAGMKTACGAVLIAAQFTDSVEYADALHDSPDLVDEATNIRIGTSYLQALIDKRTADHSADPIAEAYKDYRGLRNGIYYTKIKKAADNLAAKPESMQVLRDIVK